MIQPFQEKQHANRTTRFSELPEIVFDSWHYRHPVRRGGPCRLAGNDAARSGLPLWGVCLRGRDRGSGSCLTVYQRAGMGTAASRRHPGHSGRHRRLCLAGHHRLRLPLPDCGLGHCHRHHADRRCLYAPTGYWARMAAGAGRVLLDSLRRSHRHPARCRAAHCSLVDRHLRDRLWHPVHRALLPGALFGFSSDLTCHNIPGKERLMSHPTPSTVRADDLLRHLQDLRSGTYEGAMSRGAKEVVYRQGVELLRPVAVEILEEANTLFLNGTGNVQMIGPEEDGSGGLVTRFELSWPEQRAARVMRGPNGPLQPVRIVVNYSQGFLHPHLSGSTAGFWPFQVTSAADAGRQKGVLAAIVELELHQRIFETDWRILPVSRQLE